MSNFILYRNMTLTELYSSYREACTQVEWCLKCDTEHFGCDSEHDEIHLTNTRFVSTPLANRTYTYYIQKLQENRIINQ